MMRSSTCMFSTAAALHRVFIAPIEPVQLRLARRPILTSRVQGQHQGSQPHSQCRGYAFLVFDQKAAKSRLPRDEEIQARSVSVVDLDGKLHPPQSTAFVLGSFDRKIYTLVTVVEGEPGVPPICKIMDKKLLRESEKAQEKKKRKQEKGGKPGKTIELNWAIGDNDLGHRLKKMKDFLAKGTKVEVLLAKKKRGKLASIEECQGLINRIRKAREEVEGSKETRAMEGKIPEEGKPGGEVRLFFEGTKGKKAGGAIDEADEDENEIEER